jgi:hypothetical protein
MRIRFAAACAAVSISLLSASIAGAQQITQATAATGTAVAPAAATDADKAIVPVWPKVATKLPEDQQPVATSFALGQVEGVKPELVVGVTANGYARKVAVEGQTIGQVLVMEVAKGEKSETISAEGLTAQFDASETSELFPQKALTVEGSKAALISALEKLAADDKEEKDKTVERDTTSENSVGSNTSGNDAASSYQTPVATTLSATEDDPTITYETVTDGCPIRVDLSQEKAFVQSKTQTFSDGVLSEETGCTDSEVSYPIKKSYLSCPDVVDISAMTAWAQFTYYYADDQGETHSVSECTQDEETPYTITEDEGQCSIDLDFDAALATPQSALIYTNRSGAIVQARGCATSTLTAPIPMTESVSACPLSHDYGAKKSYELSLWTYVRSGVTYQAAPCTETGRVFDHSTIYTDATGAYVCTPITDLTGKTATLQSRKQITVDGVPQYITECTPDTSSTAIQATTDGCTDPTKWTHDVAAGMSYGQERFWFAKADGTPYYVTACQTSAKTYPHDHAITGYQHHDASLYSYPLMTVTIDISGTPYTIKSSEVLPGEQQIVYTQATPATVDRQNGAATYEGCNAYYTTTRYERWERPDDTVYEGKAIGDGAPVGPSDICSTTTENAQYYSVSYNNGGGANGAGSVSSALYYLARTVKTNPVTNEVFTGPKTTTGQTNWSVTGTSGSGCVVQPPSGSSPFASVSLGCQDEGSGYYYVTVIKGPCSSSTIYGTFNQTDGKSGSFTCGWTNNSYTWP